MRRVLQWVTSIVIVLGVASPAVAGQPDTSETYADLAGTWVIYRDYRCRTDPGAKEVHFETSVVAQVAFYQVCEAETTIVNQGGFMGFESELESERGCLQFSQFDKRRDPTTYRWEKVLTGFGQWAFGYQQTEASPLIEGHEVEGIGLKGLPSQCYVRSQGAVVEGLKGGDASGYGDRYGSYHYGYDVRPKGKIEGWGNANCTDEGSQFIRVSGNILTDTLSDALPVEEYEKSTPSLSCDVKWRAYWVSPPTEE